MKQSTTLIPLTENRIPLDYKMIQKNEEYLETFGEGYPNIKNTNDYFLYTSLIIHKLFNYKTYSIICIFSEFMVISKILNSKDLLYQMTINLVVKLVYILSVLKISHVKLKFFIGQMNNFKAKESSPELVNYYKNMPLKFSDQIF